MTFEQALPDIFLLLMAISVFLYAMLDGFDLGVGLLLPHDNKEFRNRMIASIGPFWDANETWLVLAIGILLIAFPQAYSMVLKELYIPALFLLIGLILRGVAFDFRAKAVTKFSSLWDKTFTTGSCMTSLAQGYMLGSYVMGFETHVSAILFSCLSAVCVTLAYASIGGAWLVLKTDGELQKLAARKARVAGWGMAVGIVSICIINPVINPLIIERWFTLPQAILLMPIPVMSFILLLINDYYLKHVPVGGDKACWLPFVCISVLFFLCLLGLAYSFYPYVIPNKLLAADAASATASLKFVFYGVAIVLPVILAYTLLSYRLFKGKTTKLEYY